MDPNAATCLEKFKDATTHAADVDEHLKGLKLPISSMPDDSTRSIAMTRSPKPGRDLKKNMDAGYSFQRSPVSPYQDKVVGKGTLPASPFWERKVSTFGNQGLGSATPGRRQLKPIMRGEESPDNTPTVPVFGDWDESNPSAADGFSQVFDQVREQKQNGGGTRIATTNRPYQSRKGFNNSSKGCCCFGWGKR